MKKTLLAIVLIAASYSYSSFLPQAPGGPSENDALSTDSLKDLNQKSESKSSQETTSTQLLGYEITQKTHNVDFNSSKQKAPCKHKGQKSCSFTITVELPINAQLIDLYVRHAPRNKQERKVLSEFTTLITCAARTALLQAIDAGNAHCTCTNDSRVLRGVELTHIGVLWEPKPGHDHGIAV